MKTKILNYRIIVEPDKETGTGKPGFTAYCPKLGVADDGNTIEKALKNIKNMMTFHLECLAKDHEEIPTPDSDEGLITNLKIELSHRAFA